MQTAASSLPHNFPSLSHGCHSREEKRRRELRICIVSSQFAGPSNCDDLGAASTAMADALAKAGHEVTCLYTTGTAVASLTIDHWIRQFRTRRQALVPLPELSMKMDVSLHLARSYAVQVWLRAQKDFDYIHFPDQGGLGYCTVLARRQGLAFGRTVICINMHGMLEWTKGVNKEFIGNVNELEIDFMERSSIALADVAISPDQFLIGWAAAHAWVLPEASFVQPFILRGPDVSSDATAANEDAWVSWHENHPAPCASSSGPCRGNDWPRVSLCLVTFNRPALLRQALHSIRAIVYPNLEVVLTDDGSTLPEAIAFLDELEPEFARRGWRIVRQANRYLGAARNTCAHHASGEFFLFMDDDNYADPREVTVLVQAALKTGADITVCGMHYFKGDEAPDPQAPSQGGWLPLGGCVAAGICWNSFGDANALVRRTCFENTGGFTEDYGITHEDWEFHARAMLKGHTLQMVPEFLFWYRVSDNSMLRTLAPYPNHMRSIRPFVEAVPPLLRNLVLYAQGAALAQTGFTVTSARDAHHVQMIIQWRSKLDAALELLRLGQSQAALKLMLAGVHALESCKEPGIILEAIVEISSHMQPLDPGRTRALLEIADRLAGQMKRKSEQTRIRQLIDKSSSIAHGPRPK